jgi:hypothetical protein
MTSKEKIDAFMTRMIQRQPRQGRGKNGRTPATAFIEGLPKPPQRNEDKRPQKRTTKQPA